MSDDGLTAILKAHSVTEISELVTLLRYGETKAQAKTEI
jgi:hypothetical protein